MTEYFPELDTGKRLRQTHEGMLHSSRHRREDVLLKQARKRTCDEGSFANNTHVLWSALHCIAELHFGGDSIERNTPKTPSGGMLWLLAISVH